MAFSDVFHGFNENIIFLLLFPTANDGEKALGTVNQAGTPAAVNELNNEPTLNERTTNDGNEMDESKTLNETKEKMKRDASKGSENSAHTINRNEKEMKGKKSRSFVSSEGIFFMRVPISA